MRKILFCLLLTTTLILIKQTSKAQAGSKMSLSAGFEIGLPTNVLNQNTGLEADGGLNAKLELPIFSALHLTITAGYLLNEPSDYNFSQKEYDFTSFHYFPIKGGLRFYLPKSFRYVYVEGEAGEAFVGNSPAPSSFIYSGGIGGIIPLRGPHSIEISTRYENGYKTNTNSNFPANRIAIRFAYRYQFK
jgi:hypothetical protein